MANSYVAGKWSGTLSANLKGDASKTTPTLGDDFDSKLNNFPLKFENSLAFFAFKFNPLIY